MTDVQATSYIFWQASHTFEVHYIILDTDVICYFQAVDEVNRGYINAGERLYQLKALQDNTRAVEYLKLARELPGYGEIVFPHCSCDSRKDGHVILSIGEFLTM